VRAGQLLTQAHQREEQRLALRAYATALRLAFDEGAASTGNAAAAAEEAEEDELQRAQHVEAESGAPLSRTEGPYSVQAMLLLLIP
jgi:hypothetical protein